MSHKQTVRVCEDLDGIGFIIVSLLTLVEMLNEKQSAGLNENNLRVCDTVIDFSSIKCNRLYMYTSHDFTHIKIIYIGLTHIRALCRREKGKSRAKTKQHSCKIKTKRFESQLDLSLHTHTHPSFRHKERKRDRERDYPP
jgi:hypothetical protein